jgi:uncharacterized protein YegL
MVSKLLLWIVVVLAVEAMLYNGILARAEQDTGRVASNDSSQERTQDNIVVVIDASGSMNDKMQGGRRIDVAKRSLLSVLEKTPNTTNVGILVFNGAGKSGAWWLAPLGPLDLPRVKAELAKLQPNGGTPLGESMRVAADTLLGQRGKQLGYGTFRMLMLTDGEATDKLLVEKHLPLILQRGLRVDVIGMDMKENHSLATKVNSYRPAGSGDELAGAISEVFAEIGSSGQDSTDPELYGLVSSLSSDGALSVIGALSSKTNDPLLSVAAAGAQSAAQGTPILGGVVTTPVPQGGTATSINIGSWLRSAGIGGLVCVGVGVFVLWGLLRLAKAASRNEARELKTRTGRKGRPGW